MWRDVARPLPYDTGAVLSFQGVRRSGCLSKQMPRHLVRYRCTLAVLKQEGTRLIMRRLDSSVTVEANLGSRKGVPGFGHVPAGLVAALFVTVSVVGKVSYPGGCFSGRC